MFVRSSPGERAHDARRPAGGSLKSHPVVGGIPLTPRYSPRPRLDNVRPAAAPPEEPPDHADPDDPPTAEALVDTRAPLNASALRPPVSEAPEGPTWAPVSGNLSQPDTVLQIWTVNTQSACDHRLQFIAVTHAHVNWENFHRLQIFARELSDDKEA